MRRRRILSLLLVVLLSAALAGIGWARHRPRHRQRTAPPAATGALLYPLQEEQSISGNFGQYRSDHPHGGLDLWSFLRIGTPVVAAADGVIYHIKCSSTGYGRALYERLTDGRVAVYAHFSGFAPKIDRVVRRAQQAAGSYRLNLRLDNDPIPVSRGEVIGYSGDAATDVPHLHFEIRDGDGYAVNPLLAGLQVTDTQPPSLASLYLEPSGPDAWVEGGKDDLLVPCQKQPDGAYGCRSVTISGAVGLSAYAFDRIDGSLRRLAPYDLRLMIDGKEHFRHRFDRFSYEEGRIGSLSYQFRLMLERREPFIRLFCLHERTAFHVGSGDGDLSTLSPGDHQARLLIADEHGNRAEGRVMLRVQPPVVMQDVRLCAAENATDAGLCLTGVKRVALRLRPPRGDWMTPPISVTDGNNYAIRADLAPQPGIEFEARITDAAGQTRGVLFRLADDHRPAANTEVLRSIAAAWRDDHLVVRASGGLVDGAAPFVSASVVNGAQNAPVGPVRFTCDAAKTTVVLPLPAVQAGEIRLRFRWATAIAAPVEQVLAFPFQIARDGGALTSGDGRLRVDFPRGALYHDLPVAVENVNLRAPDWLQPVGNAYRFSATWEPLRAEVKLQLSPPPGADLQHIGVYLNDRGTWWFLHGGTSAVAPFLGTFALLRDVSPPTIAQLHAASATLKVMLADLGSGVAENGIVARLDGQAQIFEYLPQKNQFVIRLVSPLAAGSHELAVWVTDRAGNSATRTFTFRVR